MKIVVLNGSPKGESSITLQYVNFIRKKFPQHEYKVFHVAKNIRKLEKDGNAFRTIIDEISNSDGVLWAFGLWVLAVSAQYMRFIELISERSAKDAFKNKYAASLSTSIHYFDHIAHNYIRSIAEDLDMRYTDGLSLDLADLRKKDERNNLIIFAEDFLNSMQHKYPTARLFKPMTYSNFDYQPSPAKDTVHPKNKKIIVLTDASNGSSNLEKMVNRFVQSFPLESHVEIVQLDDIDIRGGCLGCMRCGYDYNCQYKDGFADFYNHRVRSSDIIVFAGSVKGRFLSSAWKTFYDRAFFWNHSPSLIGKQIGYIISGPLSQIPNLIQYLEASSFARQDSNHVDIITDESEDSLEIDNLLQIFAERLLRFSEQDYIKPKNFLGVGGHKVFRDDIWGRFRMIWQADYRYFRAHGKYDFPQKNYGIRIATAAMMLLTKIPPFRRKFYSNLRDMPVKRMQRLIEKY
ncbi:MAG: NAD(P)H-dependent oxidoreductase [Deltaproteobacteria bacterium]|nr:NAD(P)H-dependent oxidoreductase [Deltaproteobacteria bacterium]